MKQLLIILTSCLFLVSCSQDGYKITGEITGNSDFVRDGEVYLMSKAGDSLISDTAKIVNGKFTFEGKCEYPFMYDISVKGIRSKISFFLENDTYKITASEEALDDAMINGGTTQKILNDFLAKDRQLAAQYDLKGLYAKYSSPAATDEEREKIQQTFESYSNEMKSYKQVLLSQNPASYFALMDLYNNHRMLSYDDLTSQVAAFESDALMSSHPAFIEIKNSLDRLAKLQAGQVAPDFTLTSDKGKDVTFSKVYSQNKVTMIDFWASWCVPCRKFNPVLKEFYGKYHKKGFEVLAVSLDNDKEAWLKAIKADQLSWLHVSDLNKWNNEVAVMYNVSFIPQNIFVDSEGKILARQLQEDEIEAFLKEQFQ